MARNMCCCDLGQSHRELLEAGNCNLYMEESDVKLGNTSSKQRVKQHKFVGGYIHSGDEISIVDIGWGRQPALQHWLK